MYLGANIGPGAGVGPSVALVGAAVAVQGGFGWLSLWLSGSSVLWCESLLWHDDVSVV